MTTSEENPSVKTAVALEEHRRKRVFTIFLALLIIPLAIGLYAIAKAPSETDAVASRVTPIVEKNVEENVTRRVDEKFEPRVEEVVARHVDKKIEPRVEEIVARRASPIIQQTLDRQLDKAVVARVQPLEQQFRTFSAEGNPQQLRMSARVKELEARVAKLEQQLAQLTRGHVDPREAIRLERLKPVTTTAKPPGEP